MQGRASARKRAPVRRAVALAPTFLVTHLALMGSTSSEKQLARAQGGWGGARRPQPDKRACSLSQTFLFTV